MGFSVKLWKALWKQFAHLPSMENEPSLIVGDLNQIANPNEKYSPNKGSSTRYDRFNKFNI